MLILFSTVSPYKRNMGRIVLPKACYKCDEPIVTAESVVLYCDCECCVALCSRCARAQLAQHDKAPLAQLLSCPQCSNISIKINAKDIVEKVEKILKNEDKVLALAMEHFQLGEYSILQRESCDATKAIYIKLIRRLKQKFQLRSLIVEGLDENSLRQWVIRAAPYEMKGGRM